MTRRRGPESGDAVAGAEPDAVEPGPREDAVEVVVDPDPVAAGAAVRARLDRGERVAGFVGDPADPAVAELVADVLHHARRRPASAR